MSRPEERPEQEVAQVDHRKRFLQRKLFPTVDISVITHHEGTRSQPYVFTGSGTFKEGDLAINRKGMQIKGERPKVEVQEPVPVGPFSVEDFQTIKVLGKGAGGVVKQVVHLPTKHILALKVLTMDITDIVRKQIVGELKMLYNNKSEYVVTMYDAFFAEGSIYIALEYMDGGALADLLKVSGALDEALLADITTQVLKGLVYLHSPLHIVHRDIKPSNILLNSKGNVKITDFGVSKELSNTVGHAVTWVGTVTYMSPERIHGREYSYNSDIWSFGLTILEAALGKYPYADIATNPGTGQPIPFFELMSLVTNAPPPSPPPGKFSAEFVSFIDQCLQKEPDKRPTASQLLRHPFILKHEHDAVDVANWVQSCRSSEHA